MNDAGAPVLVHGTCIAIGGHGVLLLGAPGSGKSDLALRLIDTDGRGTGAKPLTARLVADDQVRLTAEDGRLVARPPETLAGRLEVRGLGIVAVPSAREATLLCAARLDAAAPSERLPDFAQQTVTLCGLSLPELRLDPSAASAPAVLRAAVTAFAAPQ